MSKLIINKNQKKSKINKNIYGHFSEHLGRCIYGGLFADGKLNKPVVDALRNIQIPVLRWPGGCFADEYHWKDGIGPLGSRKKMINTHWGGVVEDNSFGTHEFLELCEALGCEPYICGNVGSGTVAEMSEWVEYMTFGGMSPMSQLRKDNGREEPWKLKYFGVGNENWGCGGNMRVEYYADEYRRYQTYVRNYGDNKIFKIACGSNGGDLEWTEVMMTRAAHCMDGLSVHYYTIATGDWNNKGSATDFDEALYFKTVDKALYIDRLLKSHISIMDRHDPGGRVELIVDEWGTWFDVEPGTNPGFLYQQNTMRDAMVAACSLNIFNKRSRRVTMANIAQTVNVLQALVLTKDDKIVLTPTYHVFDIFKGHQDNTLIESYAETINIGTEDKIPNLHTSASIAEDGSVYITLANLSPSESCPVSCYTGAKPGDVSGRILSGEITAYNDFDAPDKVCVKDFSIDKLTDDGFEMTAPACSVIGIKVR